MNVIPSNLESHFHKSRPPNPGQEANPHLATDRPTRLYLHRRHHQGHSGSNKLRPAAQLRCLQPGQLGHRRTPPANRHPGRSSGQEGHHRPPAYSARRRPPNLGEHRKSRPPLGLPAAHPHPRRPGQVYCLAQPIRPVGTVLLVYDCNRSEKRFLWPTYRVATQSTFSTARTVSCISSSDNVGCTRNIRDVSPSSRATGSRSGGPQP